jgi:hypothetical protein
MNLETTAHEETAAEVVVVLVGTFFPLCKSKGRTFFVATKKCGVIKSEGRASTAPIFWLASEQSYVQNSHCGEGCRRFVSQR